MRCQPILPLLLASLLLHAQEPPVLAAKDLPKVQGPISLNYGDPGRGSVSGMSRSIRRHSRQAPPLTRVVPASDAVVEDTMTEVSGRIAYKVVVPPGTKAHVRLTGDHEGWFRMVAFNRYGMLERGLLRNQIPTGNPEAFCDNDSTKAMEVFFIVDTQEEALQEAYRLRFTFTPIPASK